MRGSVAGRAIYEARRSLGQSPTPRQATIPAMSMFGARSDIWRSPAEAFRPRLGKGWRSRGLSKPTRCLLLSNPDVALVNAALDVASVVAQQSLIVKCG